MGKTVSLNSLVGLLNKDYKGEKIVLATGCFDLLHRAHKSFLAAAKKKGDLLVVGLETDKRVAELKGEGRPVNCWSARAAALTKLKAVDFLFPLPENFSQPREHLKILQLIKPQVLALSSNTPHLEKKKQLIKKVDGGFFVFPFNPRYSTTRLLTKDKQSY